MKTKVYLSERQYIQSWVPPLGSPHPHLTVYNLKTLLLKNIVASVSFQFGLKSGDKYGSPEAVCSAISH